MDVVLPPDGGRSVARDLRATLPGLQHLQPRQATPLELSSLLDPRLDDISPTSMKSFGEVSIGAASNDGTSPAERAAALLKATAQSAAASPPPGLQVPTGMASHGSVLHGTGQCKPCAWYWKPRGCNNGKDCRHCHMCPDDEIKNRKKARSTMMRLGLSSPKSLNNSAGSAMEDATSFAFSSALSAAAVASAPAIEGQPTTQPATSGRCGNVGLLDKDPSTC
eukprot:1108623-Amphidinium_carterae.1